MALFTKFQPLSVLSFILFFGLAATTEVTPAFAQKTSVPNVYGEWLTGDATIDIRDCGNGSPCGYIIKVDAQDSQNELLLDENNPKESLRANTLVGTRMLHGFNLKKGRWHRGRIYNPANGKSYSASLKLETPTTLIVKGCIGPFCQKQIWARDLVDSQEVPNHAAN